MTTKYVQKGEIIDYTPSAARASNDVVLLGVLLGVCCTDIAANTTGALAVEGVFDLPKKAGAAIAAGAKVNWNAANGFQTAAGATGDLAGGAVAILAAASADTVVRVKLCPGVGAAV